jgi:L-ascorbate metabolism protein UlaG (beta-lactamase superfamily)
MEASATFIGTATVLLRIGGFTLLTDPNFLHAGQRAYLGYGAWTKRRTEPAMGIDELPELDAVVLSHLHGDHFDRVARRQLPHAVPVITTPAAQRRLRQWRFSATVGLATWESTVLSRDDEVLRITAVPAQHGPAGLHLAVPQTMGSIIDLERSGQRRLRLYISGDTLYRPALLADIPWRFPDIDAALIHLGGTRLLGVLLTMDGRQGADLVGLLRPGTVVPIHYDDYPVFRDPLANFLSAATARGFGPMVHTVRRGETVDLLGARATGTAG